MYHEQMIGVCKIANGFLIEVRAPYKVKKKGGEDDTDKGCCCISSDRRTTEKELFAADAAELGKKIEALMPLIEKEEFESEEAFDKAFSEATK